jgi:GxxExxY protein
MRASIEPGLDGLTEKIIGGAFAVSNGLGHGFLEAVYKNALMVELEARDLSVRKEQSFPVQYRDKRVGFYLADLVVENQVIIELKAVDSLSQNHTAQVLNYLKASQLPIGILLNYGKPRLEMKRILL